MSKKSAAPKTQPASTAAEVRRQLEGKHVCPFCGVMRADAAQPCPRCTLDDTAATRSATKQRIGPWFVLQARNPSAPGMKLTTLQSLIRKGHVTPRSVVRGPTTDQMWTFAAGVRGLAREFGLCFNCGETVATDSTRCAHCGRGQDLPGDSDRLLLDPSPIAQAAPPPKPPETVLPPTDLLSDTRQVQSDTGMTGGISLDLQADALFPLAIDRPAAVSSAPRTPVVQRAPAPVKDEAILSARELAAAFQLDFKPQGARQSTRERRPVRTIAGLFLIAAIAGTIVLGFRSDWRKLTFDWATDKWNRVTASLEKPAKPTTPAPPNAAPVVREVKPALKTETIVPPTPSPAESRPQVVPPEKPPAVQPPVASAPTPTPTVVPPVVTPAPATDDMAVDNLTVEQATVVASDLRLKAIDAQARGDWHAALRSYEQIQRLPREAWPADLALRLDVAKRRANRE